MLTKLNAISVNTFVNNGSLCSSWVNAVHFQCLCINLRGLQQFSNFFKHFPRFLPTFAQFLHFRTVYRWWSLSMISTLSDELQEDANLSRLWWSFRPNTVVDHEIGWFSHNIYDVTKQQFLFFYNKLITCTQLDFQDILKNIGSNCAVFDVFRLKFLNSKHNTCVTGRVRAFMWNDDGFSFQRR